ncbi:MAG: oxidoreductase [Spirochaetaceae bacterium]|jgi:hypothetical protein|nr:oxidoreductase [Spirochaetaceae bacterium]
MNKLCIKLPPFSPDYSGVCSALFELGGLVIIHDASGCTGNYTGYDEPRWYGSKSFVYCSKLRELDAVLGDDEKLIQKVLDAAEDLKPRFIALLGSPVPMVIGSDMPGIAREIEHRSGIPSFGFPTSGIEYYDRGISAALLAVARRFTKPAKAKQPGHINILGITPLDFSANGNHTELRGFLEDSGWKIIASFAMGSGLDDIEKSPGASVNLVVSSGGLPLAEYFLNSHGIPYVCGLPLGEEGARGLLEKLSGAGDSVKAPKKSEKRVLIIHDQIIANSLRDCLRMDYGFDSVTVATPFGFFPGLAGEGDVNPASEAEFAALLNSGFDIIFADPLFKDLLKPDFTRTFIDFPHVAVSSKLYWNRYAEMTGNKIHRYLDERGFAAFDKPQKAVSGSL